MKRFLLTLAFVCLLAAPAFARERIWGFCSQGGSRVQVGGQKSTAGTPSNVPTYWFQTYPGCTVTVYLAGTSTLATGLQSDTSGTALANPFTADAVTGYWEFYPTDGRYDVRMSGGGIATPFTLADLQACDLNTCGGGGGGGGSIGTYTVAGLAGIVGPTEGMLANVTDGQRGYYEYKNTMWRPVPAEINILDFGAKGDGTTDDSAAFQAAATYLRSTGGTIVVPYGVSGNYKLLSSIQLAAGPGQSGNRVTLRCTGGYTSVKFTWGGTDQSPMFIIGDATNYGAVTIHGCGFQGADATHRPIAISVNDSGGSSVSNGIEQNYFGSNVYTGLQMSNTWLGWVRENRFYGNVGSCISLVPTVGPVNDYAFRDNELSGCGAWAISQTSGVGHGFSEGNLYDHNDCEGGQASGLGCFNVQSEWLSFWRNQRYEVDNGVTDGTWRWMKTNNFQYNVMSENTAGCHNAADVYCMELAGNSQNNKFTRFFWGGSAPATSTIGLTGLNNAYNLWDGGLTPSQISPSASTQRFYGTGGNPEMQAGSIVNYTYSIGSAYDWPQGRVDISGIPYGSSNSSGANPNSPTQFGTAATIPVWTIIVNRYAPVLGGPSSVDSNVFWMCKTNPTCSANPINPSEWYRFGQLSTKVRAEKSSIPTTGTWTVGDFFWNTNPASNNILGWICTVAGTPGTWVPIYAIDPANPPAWGGTTPAAGAFTTLSTSGLATLASASVTGALTAGTVNKLTLTTPATSATLTINNGKTFTVSNTMQLASTDSAVITFQGTDTYVGRGTTDTLSNKTLAAPIIQTSVVASLPAAASSTGMIYVVTDSNSATSCGTGGGSSIVLCRSNGSSWLPLGDGASSGAADFASLTGGTNTGAAMLVGTGATLGTTGTGTIQATNVLGAGLTFAGSTSGTTVLKATAIAGTTTLTLPAATDTLVGKATTDTLSNKTLDNTSAITVKDGSLTLQNTADPTKQATFTLAGITAGQTRVVTIPDAASTTVVADTGTTHNFLTAISAAGAISKAQPAFTDISGNIATSQMNSGTGASSSTWWRGDGTWASLPGGTGTVNSGAQYAIAYYASAGTAVSGHPNLLTNAAGNLLMTQGANNTTALQFTRNTDTLPTGKYLDFLNAATSSIASLDITGNWIATSYATSGIFSASGAMGSCATTAASTGAICFSSTGNRPVYGYNAGSNVNMVLSTDTLAALSSTTSSQLAGVISDETGSGSLVFATSPTLVTPTLGVATATSINKMAITAPATSSTLAVADGKSFTVNSTITLAAGADGQTFTLPATSANIFGSVTKADVLEAGLFCADAGATDAYACTLSPAITAYVTGATYIVKANTANTGAATVNLNALGVKTIKKHAGGITSDLVTNDIQAGAWIALTYDGTNMQCTAGCDGNAASGTITSGTTNVLSKYTAATTLGNSLLSDDGTTLTYTGTGGISVAALTITGTAGADTYTEIAAPASPSAGTLKSWADSTDHRFHDKNSSGTIGTTVVANTLAAHNFVNAVSVAGVVSGAQPACGDLSDAGTGCSATIANYALLVSPSFTTPTLGVASATSINKVAITAPATSATLTIADGKTLTASNTLTFTGTDSSSVAFGAGGTVRYTTSTVNTVVDTSTPVTVSTTLGAEFHFNQHATAATAMVYTLPTAAAGKQFCFANSYNGSAANTGTIRLSTSAAGQYIIYTDGTLSASNGYVISGGAAGDAGCVVGVDATHWMFYIQRGTWTKN